MREQQRTGDARRQSGRRGMSIRIGCGVLLCCATGLGSLPTHAVEPASDIRAYNHQGIQKLIALDVLRASRVANGQAQLFVGSKYFGINRKSQTRLAVLADSYLRGRNVQFSSMALIDGRTGRTIATYDPAQGLRPR